jgi:hypothetical protein
MKKRNSKKHPRARKAATERHRRKRGLVRRDYASRKPAGMKFLNIRLTTEEFKALHEVAADCKSEVRTVVYPRVLQYLLACTTPPDRYIVLDPEAVAQDLYWGTAREATEPRRLPEGLRSGQKGPDRDRQVQQILEPAAHEHLRAIKKYYRVSINDLAASAIMYAWGKMDR